MAHGDRDEGTDARLARMEANQAAIVGALSAVMDRLDVQYELLRRVLAAVEREAGPSPAAATLEAILAEMRAQTALLHAAVPVPRGGDDTTP